MTSTSRKRTRSQAIVESDSDEQPVTRKRSRVTKTAKTKSAGGDEPPRKLVKLKVPKKGSAAVAAASSTTDGDAVEKTTAASPVRFEDDAAAPSPSVKPEPTREPVRDEIDLTTTADTPPSSPAKAGAQEPPPVDPAEASKRGEKGFDDIRKTFREFSAPSRPWCNGAFRGTITGIADRSVRLVLDDGTERIVGPKLMDRADLDFLLKNLLEQDFVVFMGGLDKEEFMERFEPIEKARQESAGSA